jgi:hypothetical protein
MSLHYHSRFHIGHSLMVFGTSLMLVVALVISFIPVSRVTAFGTSEIASLSNQARGANGIAALSVNSALTAAAQEKATHMAVNSYFEHTAPDGTTGWYFIEQQGYQYSMAGENLAATNESPNAVVTGWMNSPGHRANLLNANFTEVGYGVSYKGEYQGYSDVYFVVALYAKPATAPAPAPTVVQSAVAPTPPPPTPATTAPQANPVVASEQAASTPTDSSNQLAANQEQQTTAIQAPTTGTSVALGQFPSGTSTALSHGNSIVNATTTVIVAGISIAAMLAGLSVDIYEFRRHHKFLRGKIAHS